MERVRLSLGGSFTPVVRIFLWINTLVYLSLELVESRGLLLSTLDGLPVEVPYSRLIPQLLGLVPHSVVREFAWWQPITYMFVHREFFHFLMNMLALWWFGADVERQWGTK
jgi:membrane associated rhomboid family serine protease